MFSESLTKKLASGTLLLSSFFFSGHGSTARDESPDRSAPPAAKSQDRPIKPDDEQEIKKVLGDAYKEANLEQYRNLVRAGMPAGTLEIIPPERLQHYAAALKDVPAEDLTVIARVSHALGREHDWIRFSTWVDELRGVKPATADKLIELDKLKKKGGDGLDPRQLSTYAKLVDGGAPLDLLSGMGAPDARAIEQGFSKGRYDKQLWKLLGKNHEEHSRKTAEADPDFERGAEWAKKYIVDQLKKRDHVSRPATDYKEDASQLQAIEDRHQLFLIKRYVDYFNRPETVLELAKRFAEVPEAVKEEEGGLMVAGDKGVLFIPVPQHLTGTDKRGDETHSYKSPEIAPYVKHLGILHTHPGGAGVAGPSGYSIPTYGPGKYFPHGDTYSLAEANKHNPRLIEVVVTELSPGRYNVDLFTRDVRTDKEGKLTNADPVRVVDLGVFELPPEKLKEKIATQERTEKEAADKKREKEQEAAPKPGQDGGKPQSDTESARLDKLIDESLPLVEKWPDMPKKAVTGEQLRKSFEELRKLREVPYNSAPGFIELLVYGAKPEQLREVHQWHIHGLAEGFRDGRFQPWMIKELGANQIAYSARAAAGDAAWKSGPDATRDHVRKTLEKREHLFRLDTDYDEGVKTSDATKDRFMLSIIKRYSDFFEDPANWKGILAMFPQDEKRRPERGGLMLHRDGKVQFLQVEQSEDRKNSGRDDSYQPPMVLYYGTALGLVHTHPNSLTEKPAEVAGPSGPAALRKGPEKFQADTGALRYANQGNPFFVDVVITELGKGRYNVDIYYRDVEKTPEGKAKNAERVSVLDLGIFAPEEELKAEKR